MPAARRGLLFVPRYKTRWRPLPPRPSSAGGHMAQATTIRPHLAWSGGRGGSEEDVVATATCGPAHGHAEVPPPGPDLVAGPRYKDASLASLASLARLGLPASYSSGCCSATWKCHKIGLQRLGPESHITDHFTIFYFSNMFFLSQIKWNLNFYNQNRIVHYCYSIENF